MLPRRALLALPLALGSVALLPVADAPAAGLLPERSVEPVVLTGAQLPSWSQLAAVGMPDPDPTAGRAELGSDLRDAHAGTLTVPPDVRTGVDPSRVVAHALQDGELVEIPVQVDQRFPYFLANARSDFGFYSGIDTELTYEWDVERWKMEGGVCEQDLAEGAPTLDPVPGLDDDDEVVFMADDAGERADAPPAGSLEVAVTDPLNGTVGFVYLSLRDEGPSFDAQNGYVRYERDANANEWIDRYTFASGDNEQLGSSNTGYGPNIPGTVCTDDTRTAEIETLRTVGDRFPRDGVTVSTEAYRWYASGRWMVRELHVSKPGDDHSNASPLSHGAPYGPDLIDRWKGRAFQQSPDSSISVVGFEDEQVNWEANSTLLGERVGPVRAIRETWGADSGTNVTKTETFYRDAVQYRYRMRVHPIPPDGIYTSWDYNAGVATKYFNALHPEGVDIDGQNDDVGQIDEVPTGDLGLEEENRPAFFDAPDPSFDIPLALLRWEQVSGEGDDGSLVYIFENKGATSLENPTLVPYYRDDACLDDGTGDNPVPRPWPGEESQDARVIAGYEAMAGKPYAEIPCEERQGAWGSHGIHYFFTGDTDNAFAHTPVATTEADGQQWQFIIPTESAEAIGEQYAQVVRAPLVTVVRPVA